MVAIQRLFLWYEPVYAPLDPEKTVYVHPHFRRKPRRDNDGPRKNDNDPLQRVVVVTTPKSEAA